MFFGEEAFMVALLFMGARRRRTGGYRFQPLAGPDASVVVLKAFAET
jgi:hypothetical protein